LLNAAFAMAILWAQKYLNKSQTIRAATQILLEQEYVILV
jgi:hypothetical protein